TMETLPMTDFQARIAQLTSRVAELGKTLATAKARRTALALPVLDGNKAAHKEMDEIDASLLATQREVLTLNDAITEIKRQAEVAQVALHRELRWRVAQKLALQWSPEQISGWLKQEFPTDQDMQISHEAIYRSLFIQTRGVLKKELAAHLRTARRMR